MQYCQNCVIPSTRPNIAIDDEGVCSACRAFETKASIDWKERESLFRKLADEVKSSKRGYDCVIPVSGGKDSTWQVMKCLDYGLKPLAVTWKTPARTDIGWKNLEHLVRLGVDHIDYQINPEVEKKFMYEALIRFGSTAIPMHMAIFSIPLNIAVKFEIPLVVWGENSALEYGGTKDEWMAFLLDSQWLKKYGVTQGTKASDWVSDRLSEKELTPYFGPSSEDLETKNIRAIFLGSYFRWDPWTSFHEAQKAGFETHPEGPKTGYYDFADIDDDFISIHHYFKWYKFGFTRLFDNLALEIRNGRMKREQAVRIIRDQLEMLPNEDVAKFCKFVGIPREHFFELIERFRNRQIWAQKDGLWYIQHFIIEDWEWWVKRSAEEALRESVAAGFNSPWRNS